MNAEQFNARYPVGSLVLAYPGARPEDDPNDVQLITRTRSKAQPFGGGDAAWVDGYGACISLSHIDVVTEAEWEQAQIDRNVRIAARRSALLDAVRTRPSGAWKADRAIYVLKQAGFGWVSARTAIADLEALADSGHLVPHTKTVVTHYEVTDAARQREQQAERSAERLHAFLAPTAEPAPTAEDS